QRLGRAGRHSPAEAYLIGHPGAPGIFGLCNELDKRTGEFSRQDFFALITSVFPTADTQIDFVVSKEGVFAAISVTSHILKRVESDYGAKTEVQDRVRQALLSMEKSYFRQWQSYRPEHTVDVTKVHA